MKIDRRLFRIIPNKVCTDNEIEDPQARAARSHMPHVQSAEADDARAIGTCDAPGSMEKTERENPHEPTRSVTRVGRRLGRVRSFCVLSESYQTVC